MIKLNDVEKNINSFCRKFIKMQNDDKMLIFQSCLYNIHVTSIHTWNDQIILNCLYFLSYDYITAYSILKIPSRS